MWGLKPPGVGSEGGYDQGGMNGRATYSDEREEGAISEEGEREIGTILGGSWIDGLIYFFFFFPF